jgi:hypothetical protein
MASFAAANGGSALAGGWEAAAKSQGKLISPGQ